jgi:hypothetical protein
VHTVRRALLALTYTPGETEQLLTELTAPTTPVNDQRLDEILGRANAATPGPWCNDSWEIYQGAEYEPGISVWIGETCRAGSMDQDRADAEFVAAARSDVPALVAEVQSLHTEVDKLKRSASSAEEDYRRVVRGASQIEAGLRARVDEMRKRIAELTAAATCASQITTSLGTSECALPVRHQGDHRNAAKNHHWDDAHATGAAL